MLRKLIKHELRATARVMGPMLLLTLAAAVGGNVAVHHLVENEATALNVIGVFLLMAFVAAIAGSFIVSFVLMIQRFYKNLLRDEGYLMMTLPASVHEHVFSKLFVAILWAAATAVTAILAMFILVFEMEFVDLIFHDLWTLLNEAQFDGMRLMDFAGNTMVFILEMILLMIIADACLCLQLYASMAAGHSFTHHKGLLSVAAWFAFSAAWNMLQNGTLYLLHAIMPEGISFGLNGISQLAAMHITLCGLMILLLIPTGIWYAVTVCFLKKRLNLD